jgi:hypothetical protein
VDSALVALEISAVILLVFEAILFVLFVTRASIDVILEVFEAILFAFVVTRASIEVMLVVLAVILDELDAILLSNTVSALVALVNSAVILFVFAAILFVFEVTRASMEVMLEVFEAIKVGSEAIVVELTPPTLFTVGAPAVPPRSFDS